jgi:hypothetical protein
MGSRKIADCAFGTLRQRGAYSTPNIAAQHSELISVLPLAKDPPSTLDAAAFLPSG